MAAGAAAIRSIHPVAAAAAAAATSVGAATACAEAIAAAGTLITAASNAADAAADASLVAAGATAAADAAEQAGTATPAGTVCAAGPPGGSSCTAACAARQCCAAWGGTTAVRLGAEAAAEQPATVGRSQATVTEAPSRVSCFAACACSCTAGGSEACGVGWCIAWTLFGPPFSTASAGSAFGMLTHFGSRPASGRRTRKLTSVTRQPAQRCHRSSTAGSSLARCVVSKVLDVHPGARLSRGRGWVRPGARRRCTGRGGWLANTCGRLSGGAAASPPHDPAASRSRRTLRLHVRLRRPTSRCPRPLVPLCLFRAAVLRGTLPGCQLRTSGTAPGMCIPCLQYIAP